MRVLYKPYWNYVIEDVVALILSFVVVLEWFPLSTQIPFQKYGIFGDKTLDEQLRKETGEAVEIVGGLTSPKFSYNTYIAKAMFLSAEIICKKRGIAHDKIDEKIKNDQSVRTEFKKLVSDFIKLGGVDLKSMKRTVA